MNATESLLISKGFVFNPRTRSWEKPGDYSSPVAAWARTNQSKQDALANPLAAPQVQTKGPERRLLCFTAYRTRLVDPDNNVFKWECDALRYSSILEDDTAAHVEIITKQVKVKTKAEEGTEIKITKI